MTGTPDDARLRWPLTAGLSWAAGWTAMRLAAHAGMAPLAAIGCGLLVSATPALLGRRVGVDTPWRRVFVVAGFPLLLLATGLGAALPGWAWALPLAVLALAYPVSAWRDAPVFPTPRDALSGLPPRLRLLARPRVHDAGCGLGDGLRALRAAWPDAELSGTERSWPWALAASLRCPWARVARGDMWRAAWSGLDAVYLFQRPESMGRAMAKAEAEMAPGSWLISLEFGVPSRTPDVTWCTANGRPAHAYRIRGTRGAGTCLKVMDAAPISVAWQ